LAQNGVRFFVFIFRSTVQGENWVLLLLEGPILVFNSYDSIRNENDDDDDRREGGPNGTHFKRFTFGEIPSIAQIP